MSMPVKVKAAQLVLPPSKFFSFLGRYVEVSPVHEHALQRASRTEDVIKISQVWSGELSVHHLLCSGQVYQCPTSSRVNGTSGPFSVNVKAAVGMVHAGMGPADVNSFLSSLNLPTVHHSSLKNLERKFVGPFLEALAKESCSDAVNEESKLSIQAASTVSNALSSPEGNSSRVSVICNEGPATQPAPTSAGHGDSTGPVTQEPAGASVVPVDHPTKVPVPVAVSYDMGWQKRGRAHNSLSGVGVAIGVLSGKVFIYGTRNRTCAICYVAEENNTTPRPHDCRKNWTGSSKAMEPDVVVHLATLAPTELGIQLATIIGDDDAATIRRVSGCSCPSEEGRSEVCHRCHGKGRSFPWIPHCHARREAGA